jgi:hypothetical protein
MPLQETSGAASYDAFGGGLTAAVNYIEDVFSTWLYTGNGSTQTITNGIDLSGKGGLVWIKSRSNAYDNNLQDTARGMANQLFTNSTSEQVPNAMVSANANGFSINSSHFSVNTNTYTYASWAFRKAPKFFDVVTYTGNGSTLSVNHSLASKPGCIIIKRTDSIGDWLVCTRKSTGNIYAMYLNTTAGQFYDGTEGSLWTSTAVSINWMNSNVASGFNTNGATYVMYVLAHDAGGFGASGTDNVISCGSYTGNGSTGQLINLGYEPQWVLIKQTNATDQWAIIDNARGWAQADSATLCANTANAENADFSASGATSLDPQGFRLWNANGALNESGGTYIYIAIRRGPMKTPTSGTQVFAVSSFSTSSGANQSISGVSPTDLALLISNPVNQYHYFATRLIGAGSTLRSTATAAESTTATDLPTPTNSNAFNYLQNTFRIEGSNQTNWNATGSGTNTAGLFTRAPGFFDVVCYTGTGVARTVSHNLGVAPEFIVVKARDNGTGWCCYAASLGNSTRIYLNQTGSATTGVASWNSTTPTASVFSLLGPGDVNQSGFNYVAYLFATVAGVSKVGSYTGTGTTLQVNCGFTGGARFVLIKRTDSTGDWYVWDSARGIVAGNDPYLLLNSSAAEVTGTDYIDTFSSGFEISSTAPAAINANGGTFIFLAIA